jgi:hypothetical protein
LTCSTNEETTISPAGQTSITKNDFLLDRNRGSSSSSSTNESTKKLSKKQAKRMAKKALHSNGSTNDENDQPAQPMDATSNDYQSISTNATKIVPHASIYRRHLSESHVDLEGPSNGEFKLKVDDELITHDASLYFFRVS